MIRDWQRRFRKRRLAQACGSGRQPERLLFEPLEPRLLLSADLPLLPAALVSQPEEVQQLSAEELERLQHPEAPEAPPQADAPAADGAVQAPPASTDAAAGDASVAPAGPADRPPLQGPDLATLAALQPGLHLVILDPGVEDAGPLVASLAQALGAPAPLSDGAPAQEGEAPARDHAAAAPATPPSAAEAPDARSAGNSREVRRTPEPAADEGDRVEVVRLDPGRDGVAQIDEILSGYTDLASVHLISHGAAGLLRLGNAQLDREHLAREQERIARWGQALRSGGDVLLYGCDVAEGDKGRAFVDAFARTLGRDVAASTDDTGNPALGGDWDLEYRRGMVETASAQAFDYAGLLETLAANVIYADGPTEGNFTASRRLDRVVAEIDLSSDSGDLTLRFGKGGTLMVEKGSLKLEMRLAADARVVAGQGDNTVLFGRGAAFDGVLEFPNGTQSAAIGFSSDLNDPNGLLVRGETRPVKLQPIGSSGRDFRVVAGANDFEIRNLYTVQKIVGGRGADSLVGSDLATYRDVLAGGRGDDRIQGQAGNDQLLGGQGKDQLEGGSGADDLQGEGGDDLLQGDEGDDLLSGGDGDDLLSGGLGDDTLQGGDGADELIGDYGDDTLSGGDGDDTYYFLDDWGVDTLTENAGEGRDTVDLSGVTTDLTVDISADIRVSTSRTTLSGTLPAPDDLSLNGGPVSLPIDDTDFLDRLVEAVDFALAVGDLDDATADPFVRVSLPEQDLTPVAEVASPQAADSARPIAVSYAAGRLAFSSRSGGGPITVENNLAQAGSAQTGYIVVLTEIGPVGSALDLTLQAGPGKDPVRVTLAAQPNAVKADWLAAIEDAIGAALAADPGAQPETVPQEADVTYVNGRLALALRDGSTLTLWQGAALDQVSSGPVVFLDQALPADGVPTDPVGFDLRVGGTENTRVTVNLPSTTYSGSDAERRAAWTRDIAAAIDGALAATPESRTSRADTIIDDATNDAWIEALQAAIDEVLPDGAVEVGYQDGRLSLVSTSGEDIAVWDDATVADQGSGVIVQNTVLTSRLDGMQSIEHLRLGSGENRIQVAQGFVESYQVDGLFNRTLVIDNPLETGEIPQAVLDLSLVDTAMRITVTGDADGGNRVEVVFSDSNSSLKKWLAKKLVVSNVGRIIGGLQDDTFVIEDGAVVYGGIDGMGGENTLEYRWTEGELVEAGSGRLMGLPGGFRDIKHLVGSEVTDLLLGDARDNRIEGGKGDDTLSGDAGNDSLSGGKGNDLLRGGEGSDELYGERGRDDLRGGAGDDIIKGGWNDDRIEGGEGNDTLWGGWGADTFVFEDGWGHDVIESERLARRTDTIDLSATTGDTTVALSHGRILLGNGTLNESGGKLAKGYFETGDSLLVKSPTIGNGTHIRTLRTGSGDQTFRFGNKWNSLTIDTSAMDEASRLVLDFSEAAIPLRFDFREDGSLVVTKTGGLNAVKDNLSPVSDKLGASPTQITVTGIDADTTIISGRNENSYRVHKGTNFQGVLELSGGVKLSQVPFTEETLPSGLYVDHRLDLSRYGGLADVAQVNMGPDVDWNAGGKTGKVTAGFEFATSTSGAVEVPGIENIRRSNLPVGQDYGKITDIKYGAGLNLLIGDVMPNTFSSSFGRTSATLMSGLMGADTYRFTELWGAAAVYELPDLEVKVAGEPFTAPEALDTLDFSGVYGDLEIDIYQYSAAEVTARLIDAIGDTDLADTLNAYSGPDVVSNYVIVRDTTLANLGADLGVDVGSFGTSFVVASDIESIVGSSLGTTTVRFHGDASLKGTLEAGTLGDLVLDYSDYGTGIEVDLSAGFDLPGPGDLLDMSLGLPEGVSGPGGLDFGLAGLSDFLIDRHANWGKAQGVEGNRLGGLTTLLDVAGPYDPSNALLASYGVKGVSRVIGSAFDDRITADDTRVIVEASPGQDVIAGVGREGRDGSDEILDLKNNATDGLTVFADGLETVVADLDNWWNVTIRQTTPDIRRLVITGGQGYTVERSSDTGNLVVTYGGKTLTIEKGAGIEIASSEPVTGVVARVFSADSLVAADGAVPVASIDQVGQDALSAALAAFGGKTLRVDATDYALSWDENNGVLSYSDGSDTVPLIDVADLSASVTELPGLTLADRLPDGTIRIDASAAGHGWGTGGMDLQSVLVREIALQMGVDLGASLAPGATLTLPDVLATGDLDPTDPMLASDWPANALRDADLAGLAAPGGLLEQARQAWVGSFIQSAGSATVRELALDDIPTPILRLEDLPGEELARSTEDGVVLLDPTAADHGWFVDANDTGLAASGRIDLYSVLVHEIGHALGMGHDVDTTVQEVMDSPLDPGQRLAVPGSSADSPIRVLDTDSSDQSRLAEGLGAFENWVDALGGRLDDFLATAIPFTDATLSDLLPVGGQQLRDAVSDLRTRILDLFQNVQGNVDRTDILALDHVQAGTDPEGRNFIASLPVQSVSRTFALDLNGVADLQGFDIGLSGNPELTLTADLTLDFTFGIDDGGDFYVEAPAAVLDLSLDNPDLDFGVQLGPLGLSVQNGKVDIGTEMRFGTERRLDFQALASGRLPASALLPVLGGDTRFDVTLPLVLDGGLDGLQADGATIVASLASREGVQRLGSIADLFQNVSVETYGLDGLFDFKSLSVDQIIDGLIAVLDALVDEDSALFTPLPGIDKSLAELLGDGSVDFLTALKTRLESVRDNGSDRLDELEGELNAVFNDFLGAGTDPFDLGYQDSRLTLDFGFEKLLADSEYAFALDLGDFASQVPLPDGIDVDVKLGDADGGLSLDLLAGLALDFGLAWDLSDAADPVLEVDGESGIEASLQAGFGQPVDFAIDLDLGSFGSVGFFVDDATADIGMRAAFGLNGAQETYALDELASNLDMRLEGRAALDLPMYFPTADLPLGGDGDRNGDGLADNVLHFGADFDLGSGIDWRVVSPDLENAFSLSALLNDPQRVLDGLEAVFDTLADGMRDQFAALDLPLVGDALREAGDFVAGLRDALLGDKSGDTYLNGLGRTLQQGGEAGKSTIDLIREALYQAFGPDGLDLALSRLAVDEYGRPQRDATGEPVYLEVGGPQDIGLTITPEAIGFNLVIAGEVFQKTVPLSFGAALPGFNLETEGGLDIALDYVFGLGLGLSARDGVYLDTSGATESGAEFALDLSAQLQSGTTFETTLGILRAQVSDVADGDGPSGLFGEFEIDLMDGDGNGRFGLGDSLGIEGRVAAYADADLAASLDMPVSEGLEFPRIDTTIHYDQLFAEASFGTGQSASTLGGAPSLVFQDVTLDAGDFIRGFMGPVVDKVAEIIGPVRPVIQMLTTEIGFLKQLGSPYYTLLDLAKLVLGNTKYKSAVPFIEAVGKLDDLIAALEDFGDNDLVINFGTFDIDTSDRNSPTPPPAARSGTGGGLDNASGDAATRDKAKRLRDGFTLGTGGFQFPLLTDPVQVLRLLLGKDVDLFLYDMPKMELAFDYRKSFPIFPGLNARIGGGVGATIDFGFGFDTTGIRAFLDSGYRDPALIFNGFFVSDQVEGIGSDGYYLEGEPVIDNPEVTVYAGIAAGASVGVSGLVEAGVEGGIRTDIAFDLNDIATYDDQAAAFVYDGKLRVDEIITRVDQDPLCLFDMEGALRAFLDAFFWVGADLGLLGKVTIFEARKSFVDEVLADFNHHCPDPNADIAQLDNGTLTLDYRPGAGSDEAHGERAERYKVTLVDEKDADGNVIGQQIKVASRGVVELFDPALVNRIVTSGTDHDDTFFIGENIDADIELSTGTGDDIVRVLSAFATRSRTIDGGGGDDTIETADGADRILGGTGDDIIMAGGGDDDIDAGAGVDQVEAGEGDDQVLGGAGRDYVLGGAGDDRILGGAGKDRLEGGSGDDLLEGGAGDDALLGQEGQDELHGGDGADNLTGGTGSDRLFGETGNDNIDWYLGDGADNLVDGGGDDMDSFRAYASATRDDNEVRLEAQGVDVGFVFDGARMSLQAFERLFVDLGEGADSLVGEDLSATSVSQVDVDFGTGEVLERVRIEQDGVYEYTDATGEVQARAVTTPTVFRATDPYDQTTGQQQDLVFYRQVAIDGTDEDVEYLIDENGELDLVPVEDAVLGSILVQRRQDVDPTDATGYRYDAFETRTEQRSQRTLQEALDANGAPILDANGDPVVEAFITPVYGLDSQADLLHLFGSAGADGFQVSTSGDQVLVSQRDGVAWSIQNSSNADDELRIETLAGDDRLDASAITDDRLRVVTLLGGDGSDLLLGSPFVDHLDGGAGDDTLTGGRGVDGFANTGGGEDTLVETRDADFELSDSLFRVDELEPGVNQGTAEDPLIVRDVRLSESEDITGVFSNFVLTAEDTDGADGGDPGVYSINRFFVHDFTADAVLDGRAGGDSYRVQLSSTALGEFDSLVDVRDTGGAGIDDLLVEGTDEDDVFRFDRDIVERITPRPGDSGENSVFAPVADYSTEIVVRDTSLGNVSRQTVNYLSAETFVTRGRGGDDLFLVDDSSTELEVHGDAGDDRFFIGNVLATDQVNDPRYGLVTVVTEITNGVSFPAHFYGGTGDDYFEVNHNAAEIYLHGEEDDDLFYIKALLTTEAQNATGKAPGEQINVDNDGKGQDTIAYVKNAPIRIDGGAGFDTVVVVGTEIDDTFYVFTEMVDGREVQRIFGAGLNIPEIENVERLQLLTGGGDDTVYFYGSLDGLELQIDTGLGDDTILVGGPARDFSVTIPEFQRTQIKEVPQPPRAYTEQVLVRPAYTWWEQRFRFVGLFGIRLFPYWVRHDEPAQYANVTRYEPRPPLKVPVVVTQPESVVPVHLPETRSLEAIRGSVIFRDGSADDGLDRLLVDNTGGVAADGDGLYRQAVRTLKVTVEPDALAGAIPGWMDRQTVADVLAGLINRRSAILEPDLADALAAGETRTVVIPEGYRIGARSAGADTSDVDTAQARIATDPDSGEILLYASRDIAVQVPAGFVTEVKVKRTAVYDAIGPLGSAAGLLYGGFSDIEVQLADGADDFLVQDTASRAETRVYGGGGDDRFRVKQTGGALDLFGDTSPDYYRPLSENLDALGGLLGSAGPFDAGDPGQVRELLTRLRDELGVNVDPDSLQLAPAIDADDYDAHIMAQVRFLVNRLGDSGAWFTEPALVGQWLGLGREVDPDAIADKRLLIAKYNDLVAPAERIPADIADDAVDPALGEVAGRIWELLKAEYNTLDGSESYTDPRYQAEVSQVLGLDHPFDPASEADLAALVAMLNDRYRLGIDPGVTAARPWFLLDGERVSLGAVEADVWRLLRAHDLVADPEGDDRFALYDDTQRLDGLLGLVRLHGQGGVDHALVDDRGNADPSDFVLERDRLNGSRLAAEIGFDGLESMEVHTGSAADWFNVRGVLPDTRLFLHDGDDRLYAASGAALGVGGETDYLRGDLDGFEGDLDIDFGAGRHRLMVSDEAATVGDANGLLADDRITGLSQGDIRYRTDGNLADGVWVWTSQGDDRVQVASTHRRDDVRTLTRLHTGAGDDQVEIALQQGRDGFFMAHGGQGDDRLDGSASSLPLYLFGGAGADELLGGSGDDRLFGDQGLVTFGDPVGAHLGNPGAGDLTDGRLGAPEQGGSNGTAGGDDHLSGNAGDDLLLGGAGDDRLDGGSGDDALMGDFGGWRFEGDTRRYEGSPLLSGGSDELIGGSGNDLMFGGFGSDLFHGTLAEDVMFGEYGRVVLEGGRATTLVSLAANGLDSLRGVQRALYDPVPLGPAAFRLTGVLPLGADQLEVRRQEREEKEERRVQPPPPVSLDDFLDQLEPTAAGEAAPAVVTDPAVCRPDADPATLAPQQVTAPPCAEPDAGPLPEMAPGASQPEGAAPHDTDAGTAHPGIAALAGLAALGTTAPRGRGWRERAGQALERLRADRVRRWQDGRLR